MGRSRRHLLQWAHKQGRQRQGLRDGLSYGGYGATLMGLVRHPTCSLYGVALRGGSG